MDIVMPIFAVIGVCTIAMLMIAYVLSDERINKKEENMCLDIPYGGYHNKEIRSAYRINELERELRFLQQKLINEFTDVEDAMPEKDGKYQVVGKRYGNVVCAITHYSRKAGWADFHEVYGWKLVSDQLECLIKKYSKGE